MFSLVVVSLIGSAGSIPFASLLFADLICRVEVYLVNAAVKLYIDLMFFSFLTEGRVDNFFFKYVLL